MASSWNSHPLPFPTSSLPKSKMPSFDSYNAKTTSISYPWPTEVTGIERIALSAQGDLQRVLSAFFATPIVIALVYSQTFRQASPQSSFEPVAQPTPSVIESASPSTPIVQTRQVHLQCGGKIACTATSTVRITSPESARLFLQEKYAIGQMFRRLEKVPAFELRSVGLGPVTEDEKRAGNAYGNQTHPLSYGDERTQLWRKYTLTIPDFECEILEVFPSREMFVDGEKWLAGDVKVDRPLAVHAMTRTKILSMEASPRMHQALKATVALCVLLIMVVEVSMYRNGRFAAAC